MSKIFSLSLICLSLIACESMKKSTERNPAQNKGNGEVGSVNTGSVPGSLFITCTNKNNNDYYLRVYKPKSGNVTLSLAQDANEIDAREISRNTWNQLETEEIPFQIIFSAYTLSMEKVFRTAEAAKLEGKIISAQGVENLNCTYPQRSK